MGKIIFNRRQRIKKRVRSEIVGSADRPRISVFRSNKYIYGQAIDDQKRTTIVAVSSLNFKEGEKTTKISKAHKVGQELGKMLLGKKIRKAVFDRGQYGYKGNVQAFCKGLREAGVQI